MSYVSEYNRLRKNLLAQIRYLRKQGYEIDIEIPDRPKRITAGSVRRLKKIKQKIPQIITYKGHKGYGAYREKRQELKEKREKEKIPEEQIPEETPDQEEWIPETEEDIPDEWKEPPAPSEEDWEDVSAGEIVYQRIMDLLHRGSPPNIPEAEDYIIDTLDDAINDFGWNEVMKNLAETSADVIDEADLILRYDFAYNIELQTHNWMTLIKFGEMLTEEQARGTDNNAYPNEGEYG